jgi:hypothetical protein
MGRYKTIWNICPKQIACDGLYISPEREMCGKCEIMQKKRNANKNTSLKGERHLAYEATRERGK